MSDNRTSLLMRRGMPSEDAESSLRAYDATPAGEPYGADAIRVASIFQANATT